MLDEYPEIVYHYCSLDVFLKIMENRNLWLCEIIKSNDSKEIKWIIELANKLAKELLISHSKLFLQNQTFSKDHKSLRTYAEALSTLMLAYSEGKEFVTLNIEQYNKIAAALLNARKSEYENQLNRILNDLCEPTNFKAWATCFSEDGDTLRQWLGYGDEGCGVSIGFDINYLSAINKLDLSKEKYIRCGFRKVLYPFLAQDMAEILGINIPQQITNEALFDYLKKIRVSKKLPPIYKNPSFIDENEWRIYFMVDSQTYFSRLKRIIQNDSSYFSNMFNFKEEMFFSRKNQIVSYVPLEIIDIRAAIKKIFIGPKAKVTKKDIQDVLIKYEYIRNCQDDNIKIIPSETTYQ